MGPVYDVEHKSGFQDIIQNVEKIKNLAGPVYDVVHSNHFQDVMKGVDKVRTSSTTKHTGSVKQNMLMIIYPDQQTCRANIRGRKQAQLQRAVETR